MYEELLDKRMTNDNALSIVPYPKKEKFLIDLSPTSNTAEKIDIEVCISGCKSLFPLESFSHFGVRWDSTNANIGCWCLMSNAFDRSMIGPQVKPLILIRCSFN